MLVVQIQNDGTGDQDVGHYDYVVSITASPTSLVPLARGRIEGHKRADGWRTLLRLVADESGDLSP